MKKYTKSFFLFALSFVFLSSYILNFGTYVAKANSWDLGVSYEAHVQHFGWQNVVEDGEDAGTHGQGLRLEALKISLKNAPSNASITYQAHVQNESWQDPITVTGNQDINSVQEVGTNGQGLRMEALKITVQNLPGYSVKYRAHVQDIGWQDWVTNGEIAGTTGKGLRIEALEIEIVPNIASTSISLNKTSGSLAIGKTDKLTAALNPSDSTDAVNWSSSNDSVASVDGAGNVTGKVAGQATITAATESGLTASCTYTVTAHQVSVTKLKLNKNTDSINLRTADTLTATLTPANATDTNVNWVSSDTSVATVNNGVVTAVNVGVTTITAISEDGNYSDNCVVTVKPIAVTSIKVSKTTDTIAIGGVDVLSAAFTPTYATDTNVNWRSSNTNVVTVDSNGVITGISKGVAIVTAISEDGGKTSSCTVTVSPNSVTSILLSSPSNTIPGAAIPESVTAGYTFTLAPTITPDNATNQSVLWTTSNPNVATVSNGIVTGVKSGTAIITATTLDGAHTAKCTVTVNSDPNVVTGITIQKGVDVVNGVETIAVSGKDILTATVLPASALQSVTWTSDDNTKVQVNGSVDAVTGNQLGTITGISAGSTYITAYSNKDNTIKARVLVTVTANPVMVSGISLSPSTYNLPIGSTYKITPTIAPYTATNKNVTFSVVDPLTLIPIITNVATVDSTGTVAGLRAGTVKIKVTAADGSGVSNYCTINVVPVSVTSISLNRYTDTLFVGQTDTLIAYTNPSNATNQNVTWSSSNNAIATVDSAGVITAVTPGIAQIYATSNDGSNKTATCKVTVSTNPYLVTGVTLIETGSSSPASGNGTAAVTGNLAVNETATLTATVNPPTASNKNVIWTVTDVNPAPVAGTPPTVVSFTVSGSSITVTGLNSGTAKITATSAADPTKSATCTITVP